MIFRMTEGMRRGLLNLCQKRFLSNKPDFVIGPKDDPYLIRHYIVAKNWFVSIYYHLIRHDDEDRAKHDHVSVTVSLILEEGYTEVMDHGTFERTAGQIILRSPWTPHRLVVHRNVDGSVRPAKTIFITLIRFRTWGFHCPKKWVPYYKFVDQRDQGVTGQGCD